MLGWVGGPDLSDCLFVRFHLHAGPDAGANGIVM